MERDLLSIQPLLHISGNDPREEPACVHYDGLPPKNEATDDSGHFGDVSPLRANEVRVELGHFGHGSPLLVNEEPLGKITLEGGDIEMNEASQHSHQGMLPPDTEAQTIATQDSSDIRRTNLTQQAAPAKKRSPTALHPIGLGWKRCSKAMSRMWDKSWTMETFSYTVSILALAGLVTTLLAHQSRPLPQWPQLVTINSIISLFSLLMRACVGVVLAEGISQCKWNWYRKAKKLDHIERLDSASRGSWGSITLLYHFRPKQACYLATLGAIITIMASLTGFFSQQLVQFKDCLEKDTAALVNISRTNSYARVGGFIHSNEPVDYAPMVAAINVGVLQSPGDLTSVLSSGCSSGNCTFSDTNHPSFSTVAITHFCEDITARIRIVNESRPTDHDPYTRVYLGLKYGRNQSFEWSKERGGPVVWSWTDLPSNSSDLIVLYFLFRPHWNNMDWKVTNCSLFPTFNTYAASIKDAILEESLVDTVPLKRISVQFNPPTVNDMDLNNLVFLWDHRMTTNYTIRNGKRESCEGSDSPAPGLTRFLKSSNEPTYLNLTGHTNPSAGWKWWYYPKDCNWSMRRSSNRGMVDTLNEVFNNQNVSMGWSGGIWGSAHLRVLFQDGNITIKSVDERIKGLATAMTTVIRSNGGDGNATNPPENAIGTLWNNTTCMYIRWSWITFPAVMIALSGVFLILVAFENRGIETDRLWKSSFLAAIFCEVEVHEKPVGKGEMKAVAKSTSVSLEGKSETLRLVAR